MIPKRNYSACSTPVSGERANAVELLHAHQQQTRHLCSDIVYEVENSVPLQQYTDEVNEHNKTKAWLNNIWLQMHNWLNN